MPRRILFISTPMAPLGSQGGGGVETVLTYLTPLLAARGHEVAVVAPKGSTPLASVQMYQVSGTMPASATIASRDAAISASSEGMVERMWLKAREVQDRYDVIVSQSHDWLSYYLTPFFNVPVLHWITLCSGIDAVDKAIAACHETKPSSFAFYSHAQAASFAFTQGAPARVIPGAVALGRFAFQPHSAAGLVWSGRISPEKGLIDAIRIARLAGMKLHVCGAVQDEAYWKAACAEAEDGIIYHGALSHDRLAPVLGNAAAMLMTPEWVEAFGLTVLESLACGTPVITYKNGGPAEIVEHGKSGFHIPKGNIQAAAQAVKKLGTLQRAEARRRAEEFSYEKMAERIEAWINSTQERNQRTS